MDMLTPPLLLLKSYDADRGLAADPPPDAASADGESMTNADRASAFFFFVFFFADSVNGEASAMAHPRDAHEKRFVYWSLLAQALARSAKPLSPAAIAYPPLEQTMVQC